MSNFDLTDKAQESIEVAVQLAKDYANAQVHPAHIAFALLNEGAGDQAVPGGLNGGSGTSLFSSVIQKAGGDPVCRTHLLCIKNNDLTFTPIDSRKARNTKTHCPDTFSEPTTRGDFL